MKRIWNNGMALLLVLAMLLPMLGMAQPVMAAEGNTAAVTETDTGAAVMVPGRKGRVFSVRKARSSSVSDTSSMVSIEMDVPGSLRPDRDYTYDVTIRSHGETSVKDVTVFDQIENVETNPWQGFFRGVGYDDAVAHGATGVTVWYSADRNAPIPDDDVPSSLTAENILTTENGWFTEADWNAQGKYLSDVKVVAMQLGGMELGKDQSVTVQIRMTAPSGANGYISNRAHMLATIQDLTGAAAQIRIHDSCETSVVVEEDIPTSYPSYLYLTKTLKGVPEGIDISNEEFTFQVKLYDKASDTFVPASNHKCWIDCGIGLTARRTDEDGNVTFKAGQRVVFRDLSPRQRFEITEQEPGIGWRCTENKVTGSVGDDGTSTFASITNTWDRLTVRKGLAGEGTTSDAAQAFDMADGDYGFKLVDGEYVSDNKGKYNTTATSTWTARYDMERVSFKYSYSSESGGDKFTLTVAGETIEDGVSGATTVKAWSGTLKKGDTIVMQYAKDNGLADYDDQCKVYDVLVLNPADTEDGTEFTFELKDADGNPVADAPLIIGDVSGSTDADGRFRMKAGQTAGIAVPSGEYTVAELPTAGYEQVSPANGEAAHVTVPTEGGIAVEFLNVAEDDGYVFPKTGGIGTMPIYGIGVALALCGYAVLAAIRKRKDGDA